METVGPVGCPVKLAPGSQGCPPWIFCCGVNLNGEGTIACQVSVYD